MSALVYGVSTIDAVTLSGVRQATRVSPMDALRS
jgi:hypothetical protein